VHWIDPSSIARAIPLLLPTTTGPSASDGRVAATTLRTLERLAASGRKLILVTGRELDELLAVFPEIGMFDRVVAENGAVLYTPKTKAYRTLGEAPSRAFVSELLRRGVEPLHPYAAAKSASRANQPKTRTSSPTDSSGSLP